MIKITRSLALHQKCLSNLWQNAPIRLSALRTVSLPSPLSVRRILRMTAVPNSDYLNFCGFVELSCVQQIETNPQVRNKSTTNRMATANPQHLNVLKVTDIKTVCNKSATIIRQIHNKSKRVHNKSR